ncbi:DUF3943 domain-containing protein [Alteromonas aestuariivivens]|uniref:DUF3943 domain-containing protein n=1 Tax=Alteromonas aestuariivivens TaxID=1938339 RepID=A0A3D8MFF5_9ALTE|nr:DUF3943 domain-containing protein [Alteromonas aestuariivivens]RDV28928.1 DUF3943 domain-containing protein [Alteromonas aestuariivivens]
MKLPFSSYFSFYLCQQKSAKTRVYFHSARLGLLLLTIGACITSIQARSEETSCEVGCEEQTAIERPLVTNTTIEASVLDADYFANPYRVSLFSQDHGENGDRLWSQTKSMFGYGLGVIAVLYAMPEDFTNWDKNGEVLGKWSENVKEVAVWDRDVWYINYIGHPYFGGVYYQVARKSGYRQWDSFVYAALMSTFYWEYGVEAFAERPSLQDLVATPVGGWLWGEWMYRTEMDIRANGGELWGSKGWGSTALFLLDPVDSLGRGMNRLFNRQIVKAGTGYINVREVAVNSMGDTENQLVLGMSFLLGDGSADTEAGFTVPDYTSLTHDPVDYSMISVGLGVGHVLLDDLWGLDNDVTGSMEIGLHFSRRFSAHLAFSRGYPEATGSDERIPYENYSLNGQYYFNTEGNLRPYLALGFGQQLRDQDRDLDVFVVHAGVGLYGKITDKWAWQADWRAYHSTRFDSTDSLLNLMMIYRFGKGEWY